MTAYYNELDPHAAAWLRELIKAGHIPAGDVDERSIEDVRPDDLRGYHQHHFFAGIGGWAYALRLAGWPDDQRVWTGSCPCQPFSAAGKGIGFEDERHLWPAWQHLIAQCRPSVVFGEQVEGAVRKGWLDRVASDLEGLGYAFGAAVLQASAVDAPHRRDRLWFVADAEWDQQPRQEPRSRAAGRVGRIEQSIPWNAPWPRALDCFRAVDDALPRCVEGTDAARNAIVPQVAAEFVQAFLEARSLIEVAEAA
ncbi:DNA (cytosine-5)-methyltransferase 1 [Lysobacter sp. OAE881]|uniref:DNA cytosine methyltransferase n=1 Tax=Lysobacter sp. OAE881 TaxID=2663813 RepID=UPI00178A80BF